MIIPFALRQLFLDAIALPIYFYAIDFVFRERYHRSIGMGKSNPRKSAHETAILGNTDAAFTQLVDVLATGDSAAAASLAEISAFRGQWADMLGYAYQYLRKPNTVYAGNIFTDINNLVALAGIKTGAWSDIQTEVSAIRDHLLSQKDLREYADESTAFACGISQLINLAHHQGKAPYVWDWSNHSPLDENEREEKFHAGMTKIAAKKNAFKNNAEKVFAYFAYAYNVGSHQSAVQLFDREEGITHIDSFEIIAFVASSLSRVGRLKEAWHVIETSLPKWWPVDFAQIAPVVLLTDEGLRPLMTPERCAWVLRTPRGPAA